MRFHELYWPFRRKTDASTKMPSTGCLVMDESVTKLVPVQAGSVDAVNHGRSNESVERVITGRTALLVTGMHRSGTSALARTLSIMGAALPDELVPPNPGNPEGHWEPQGMVDINDRMLADAGSDLYSMVDVDPEWFETPSAGRFTLEAQMMIEQSLRDEHLIVLKDPRTALFLPIWTQALATSGFRVVHVLPLRNPSEVAASLRRRHLAAFPYDAWREPRGEAVWIRYTMAAVRGSRGHERAFLKYDDLLANWRQVVARLGRELGIAWPKLGTTADAAVDSFLHDDFNGDSGKLLWATQEGGLQKLDFAQLAQMFYALLIQHGDDGTSVDALHREFSKRVFESRSILMMLESLYPIVWQYFEANDQARQQLAIALGAETKMRLDVQTLWAALMQANGDRMALQQDAGSREKQVTSLRSEVFRLDENVQLLEQTCQDLRFEALRLREDVSVSETRRALSEAANRDEARAAEQIIEQERLRRSEAEARLAALYGSTSWRLTKPFRAIARTLRGSS